VKVLCAAPGPTHSTIDVYNGIVGGLREVGHQVGEFRTHNSLDHANRCLQLRWEAAGSPIGEEPDGNNVLFHASSDVVLYALYHEVNWVVFVSCGIVHPSVYTMLRRAHVPTAMVLTESPHEDERQAQAAQLVDVVWTNERTSVAGLRSVNPNTHYLQHAYAPTRHCPSELTPDVPAHEVVFIGTLWQERIDLLSAVDWSGIDLGIYGSADLFDFERFPSEDNERKRAVLEPYLHIGFIDNQRTTDLYRAAKLGLNLHRTSVRLAGGEHILSAESMNPRCYEQAATGGALLVTDARERGEVLETFGEAVATFDGPEQLEDLVRTLLYDDDAREQRADAMRQAVMPHTFAARAAQMTADLAAAKGA
jgi:hypothetical protein